MGTKQILCKIGSILYTEKEEGKSPFIKRTPWVEFEVYAWINGVKYTHRISKEGHHADYVMGDQFWVDFDGEKLIYNEGQ